MDVTRKPATKPVVAQHEHLATSLPMQDRQDFEDARRGFVAALEPGSVRRRR